MDAPTLARLTPAAERYLEERLHDLAENRHGLSREQWLAAGLSPDHEALQSIRDQRLAPHFGIAGDAPEDGPDLATVGETPASVYTEYAGRLRSELGVDPARDQVEALIADENQRVADLNGTIAARRDELRTLYAAGKRDEALALERSIVGDALGAPAPADDDTSGDTSELDPEKQAYLAALINLAAQSATDEN